MTAICRMSFGIAVWQVGPYTSKEYRTDYREV